MGLWFAASLPGGIIGSWLGGLWDTLSKPHFFLMIALAPALAGLALYRAAPGPAQRVRGAAGGYAVAAVLADAGVAARGNAGSPRSANSSTLLRTSSCGSVPNWIAGSR